MKTSFVILLFCGVIATSTADDEECQDTNGTFEINRDSIANPGQKMEKRCGWLATNMDRINRYCDRADVKVTCPFTCCECGNCVLPTPSPTVPPPTCVDGTPPSKGKGKGGKGKGGTPCPTSTPSATPSVTPTAFPSASPTASPSAFPSLLPSKDPSAMPSSTPSMLPTSSPVASPSVLPSFSPSESPSTKPSLSPSVSPSSIPSAKPTSFPSSAPSPCQDTNGTFEINRDSIANPGQKMEKRCGWLATNMDRINRYCDRADVKDTCPFTCCECENCVLPTPSPSKMPTSAPSKGKGKGGKGIFRL